MNFYYRASTKLKRDGYMEYFTTPLTEIPIKKLNLKNNSDKNIYTEIIQEVDELMSLTKKKSAINPDFNRYIDSPIIDYVKFGTIYHDLNPSEQEADKTTKGKIKRVNVTEDNNYLRFSADYITTTDNEETETTDHTVIKCKINNEHLRRFIMYYANSNWNALGTGNLFSKILNAKIPLFSKNKTENLTIRTRIADNYTKALEEIQKLDAKIEKADHNLDKIIYDLYGIDSDERNFIDSELLQALNRIKEEDQEETA